MANKDLFTAKEICPNTWQISYSFIENGGMVYAYLLEGSKSALVVDTMYGYGNLRSFCESLTDKPLKLVNTHFHGDHTSGNYHFDEAYVHWRDLPWVYNNPPDFPKTAEELYNRAKSLALPGYAELIDPGDFCSVAPMLLHPIEDGDIFDLGGRKIEVIWVGGHSAGSVALLDRKNRCAFTGDCCNSNTLFAGMGNALSVEEYLNNLLHFYSFRSEFDITYGGHQVLPASVVEEGMELCGKVLAGSDDRFPVERRGKMTYYGYKIQEGGFMPENGKVFNISYDPALLRGKSDRRQIH